MKDSEPIYVYADVDDTLVRSAGGARVKIPAVLKHVRSLFDEGAVLYCWSAGGADYARRTAEEFGIADCFVAFLPKPNVLIDDQAQPSWPRCITVHPASCTSACLGEYRMKLNGANRMNNAIELHDSVIGSVEKTEKGAAVNFAPAYVHKSAGRPGIDPGSGSIQQMRLTVFGGVISGHAGADEELVDQHILLRPAPGVCWTVTPARIGTLGPNAYSMTRRSIFFLQRR